MTMPLDSDARRYYRVAFQRLDDGVLMLEKLERPKAAVYLAGYAVECILKALIVGLTPSPQRQAVLRSFHGAAAHDLLWLRSQLRTRHNIPGDVARELVFVASWSVDLRYEPGPGNYEDAERFLSSTQIITEWANRSM